MPPQQPMSPVQQPQAQSQYKHHNGLLIPFILLVIFFIGVSVLAAWAYMERSDYKNNVDKKVEAAVTVAVQNESTRKDAEFVQREKEPTKTYSGPSAYGSVSFKFPKNWSGHVIEKDKSSEPLNGYFHPSIIPDVGGGTAFALRFKVVDKSYADVLKSLTSKIKTGKLKSTSYKAKNVDDVVGVRLVGELNREQKDTVVILPVRDKTLMIWTESDDFVADFDKFVLTSLTFSP